LRVLPIEDGERIGSNDRQALGGRGLSNGPGDQREPAADPAERQACKCALLYRERARTRRLLGRLLRRFGAPFVVFTAMAARSEASPARWRQPFSSWMDGVEAEWAIPLLLFGFVGIWQAFLVIAYFGGDLHPDVLETWTLGRSIAWGYSKHPPLMGWVARTWTSVFPLSNWSFQLMALTNAAIALWMVDLISRRFAKGDKRLVVLLLLMLSPTYQLHAQRFNANAVLLATWPLATYCFLRSFETRQLGWAVAAGATAALAMLGKYYSAFLIVSFAFAAILHQERRAYFGSLAPWASLITGLVAFGPHLHWLATTGGEPGAYAFAVHGGKPLARALNQALLFIPGVAMVLALPAAIWILIAGERLKAFVRDFRALNSGLWLLFLISVGTIVFPVITALVLRTDMEPIWALQGLFLFAILIVCGASYSIERFHAVNLAVIVVGLAVLAVVVVAPVHALYRNSHPLHEGRNFYREAAAELTRQWHAQFDTALSTVGGDDDLAFALAFYSPDHPVYTRPLVNAHRMNLPDAAAMERGWAAMCPAEDTLCIADMMGLAAGAPRVVRSEFIVRSTLLGRPGASQRFAAIMVPPAARPTMAPPAAVEDLSAIRRRPVHPRPGATNGRMAF
jgi:Dolichyl-phosphate-mannose-protein mannosyltransferase